MKKIKVIFYLLFVLTIFSCRKDRNNTNKPPVIKFERVLVSDNQPVETTFSYSDTSSISVNSGYEVSIDVETEAENTYEQMDIVVYGLAKDANNNPLDTAYLVNSFGQKTYILGNPALGWPNTSFRDGFVSSKTDKFKIVLPKITDKTDVVIFVQDKVGLSSNKKFSVTKY